MTSMSKIRFKGDKSIPAVRREGTPSTPEPYVASKELIRAVNLAIHLERPLLLEGEAGCGKTKLARAVAYELGLPFFPWYVNSKTRIEDGLYRFDAIGRLYDAQVRTKEDAKTRRNPDYPVEYREFGPLGNAFKLDEYPAVVLIDEIDKASIDFPNDLLTALDDDYKFNIPETNEPIVAKCKPVIIITSNREKGDLPEPFLRRCVYFYVEFPKAEDLRKIVGEHYEIKKEQPPTNDLIEAAIKRFFDGRDAARAKRPGTSEFLDWMKILDKFEPQSYSSENLTNDRQLPYPETLFKSKEDWERHAKPVTPSPESLPDA